MAHYREIRSTYKVLPQLGRQGIRHSVQIDGEFARFSEVFRY